MIYVIVGPTGVGKTKLSVSLAKKLNAEIINADSMQIFRGLDIGTAKITEDEKEGVIHHLFDIKEPTENYAVYDYQMDARRCIDDILKRGKNVILVGGTGLYIKACLYDYRFTKETKNDTFDELSNEEILNRLSSYTDEVLVHPNNRKRLVRLLNQYINDSIPEKVGNHPLYDFKIIGLTTNRNILYEKIDKRVDIMLQNGLLEEVKALYDKGIRSKAVMTGIGYKELYSYFDGEVSLEEAISKIKQNSRRYAKRQYTFFNHQLPVVWYSTNYENFNETIENVWEGIRIKHE